MLESGSRFKNFHPSQDLPKNSEVLSDHVPIDGEIIDENGNEVSFRSHNILMRGKAATKERHGTWHNDYDESDKEFIQRVEAQDANLRKSGVALLFAQEIENDVKEMAGYERIADKGYNGTGIFVRSDLKDEIKPKDRNDINVRFIGELNLWEFNQIEERTRKIVKDSGQLPKPKDEKSPEFKTWKIKQEKLVADIDAMKAQVKEEKRELKRGGRFSCAQITLPSGEEVLIISIHAPGRFGGHEKQEAQNRLEKFLRKIIKEEVGKGKNCSKFLIAGDLNWKGFNDQSLEENRVQDIRGTAIGNWKDKKDGTEVRQPSTRDAVCSNCKLKIRYNMIEMKDPQSGVLSLTPQKISHNFKEIEREEVKSRLTLEELHNVNPERAKSSLSNLSEKSEIVTPKKRVVPETRIVITNLDDKNLDEKLQRKGLKRITDDYDDLPNTKEMDNYAVVDDRLNLTGIKRIAVQDKEEKVSFLVNKSDFIQAVVEANKVALQPLSMKTKQDFVSDISLLPKEEIQKLSSETRELFSKFKQEILTASSQNQRH